VLRRRARCSGGDAMKRLIVACMLLAGCSGTPKLPDKVLVPVSVPCITEAIPAPAFVTDSELAKSTEYDFIISLARDRLERRQYIGTLEAVVEGCR